MYIKRQGGLALAKACGFTLSACREAELQLTDFTDPVLRILTASDSRPSITPNSLVTPCVFSCRFLPALSVTNSLNLSLTLAPFILFSRSCSVLSSLCILDSAVFCWATGSSLVLKRRSLIQFFKKLSGRMWLISFYTKSLNASHSLSRRMRLACKMTLMLFTIKHFLPFFLVFLSHLFTSLISSFSFTFPFFSYLFLWFEFPLSLIHLNAIEMNKQS